MMKRLIDGNKQFRELSFGPKNHERLTAGQKPHTLWIGCSDSRVPAELLTNAELGELFVHRNVANIVPTNNPAVSSVVFYAVEHLHVKHIALCGHYLCGGIAALWKGSENGNPIGDWLESAQEALVRVRRTKGIGSKPEDEALRLLVEENLRVQREHLMKFKIVREAVNKKKVNVITLVYDIATGKLKELKK